ncbi:MAG: thiamine biosynthesis protein ThiF [Comamonadaceae bacterium PBBC1]|nr:MAG: thiamine biosynthesis protein ThiF [Comamonadaceae bacterium PBBC1]
MSVTGIELSTYVDQLKRNGFTYSGKVGQGWLKFTGDLNARGTAYACEFLVPRTLDEIPLVTVKSLPRGLPKLLPHLTASGYLCYIAAGSIALDLFDPIGQTLACLQQAGEVLARVLADEMVEDLVDEFYSFWGEHDCLLDIQGNLLGAHPAYFTEDTDTFAFVVSDDKARTERKLQALGHRLKPQPIVTIRVRTSVRPFPLQKDWPPKDVGSLLRWQSAIDPSCRRRLEKKLMQRYQSGYEHATVIIDSPGLHYGFFVKFNRPVHRGGRRRDSRQVVYGLPVTELRCIRIDDKYIAERSMPDVAKTLSSLDVVLVGCGTIGGFLAEMLVKAGAGSLGGRLTLVDCDSLGPQNLGRHRLGMPHMFKNKAVQMAAELERLAPGVRIDKKQVDVKTIQLGKPDLLIDTTGAQSLTDWLMWRYAKSSPMLAAWVEGPGLAVRALMKHSPEHACSRCITQPPQSVAYQVFTEPTPTVLKGHGCEGLFVPFPATASIQAASLAMEMLQAWLEGRLEHTLQTRVLDNKRTLKTGDCTPTRQEGCLACHS